METKQRRSRLDKIRRNCRFTGSWYVDPIGKSGGLALWWDDSVDIHVYEWDRNLIETDCCEKSSLKKFAISWIYGEPERCRRKAFWQNMMSSIRPVGTPWMCIGDMNTLCYKEEKLGGQTPSRWQLDCLQNFVSEGGLLDLGFQGNPFTWANNQVNGDYIMERLDRALATTEWRDLFPYALVFHGPLRMGSDHAYILLNTSPKGNRKKLFKFEAMWTKEEECKNVIKRAWNYPVLGSEVTKWQKHGYNCGKDLMKWSKLVFKDRVNKIEQHLNDLKDLQCVRFTSDVKMKELQLKEDLNRLQDQEEMFWHQRSRINWLNYGDKNTRFFHSTATQRRQNNQIQRLKDDHGVWIEEEDQVANMVTKYFKLMYTANVTDSAEEVLEAIPELVTNEMKEDLTKPMTSKEIKAATFQMGGLKSPGPDGFPGVFYHNYWDVVGDDLISTVHEIYVNDFVPEALNKTYIVLIPKTTSPDCVSLFRPISLCNFAYKVFSKVLANRLKCWIGSIVSEQQGAFISGRCIQDNILVAHEVFHKLRQCNRKRDGAMALKLDLKKAFDMVNWRFLCNVMSKFGFPPKWINCIMACISSVSYAVILNGTPLDWFKPTRGIRQGDPISPYLFLLVSDALSRFITFKQQGGFLRGFLINPRCPILTHILFADDTLLFGKANCAEASAFKKILNVFVLASGQQINFSKSSILFGKGVPYDVRHNILHILQMNELQDEDLYLGLPSLWDRSKVKALKFVLERVTKKAQSWKQRLLSMSGREVMVKAVLSSIPVYTMQCIKFPKSFCNSLNSILAHFWWNGNVGKNTIHWMSWKKITTAKCLGGLGFKDMGMFNDALLGKQAMRIVTNPNLLCAKLLKGIYFPRTDFLQAAKGNRSSWIWQSIFVGKEHIKNDVHWRIGDGNKIGIWRDQWIPSLPQGRITTAQPLNCDPVMVCDLRDDTSGGWKTNILRELFNQQEAAAITELRPPQQNITDRLVWRPAKNGNYSVKVGYLHLKQLYSNPPAFQIAGSENPPIWRVIWKLDVPPKLRIFIWRSVTGCIPTANCMKIRNLGRDDNCSICNQGSETILHTLVQCLHANVAWFHSFLGYYHEPHQHLEFKHWFWKITCDLKSLNAEHLIAFMVFLCWQIWKARNEALSEGRAPDPQINVLRATRAWKEWIALKPSLSMDVPFRSSLNHGWIPPHSQEVMVNCDGAWTCDDHCAGIGVVARNDQGQVIDGLNYFTAASSALEAEVLDIRAAFELARINFKDIAVHIQSDCKTAVDFINGNLVSIEWGTEVLATAAKLDLGNLHFCTLSFITRSGNEVANWVATKSRVRQCVPNWKCHPPEELHKLLYLDCSAFGR